MDLIGATCWLIREAAGAAGRIHHHIASSVLAMPPLQKAIPDPIDLVAQLTGSSGQLIGPSIAWLEEASRRQRMVPLRLIAHFVEWICCQRGGLGQRHDSYSRSQGCLAWNILEAGRDHAHRLTTSTATSGDRLIEPKQLVDLLQHCP